MRIAFGRDRDDRDRAGKGEDDWKCDIVGIRPAHEDGNLHNEDGIDGGTVFPTQLLSSYAMFSMQCSSN